MSLLNDTWRGLVQRRLWPIALLLLAALAAVPFVLAEDVEPPAPVPAAGVAGERTELLTSQPIVTTASAQEREERRHVVGSKNDPFKPAPAPKAKKAADAGTQAPSTTPPAPATSVASAGGGVGTVSAPSASGGGSGFSPAPSPVTPVAGAPVIGAAPRKTAELYSLSVRWGASEALERPKRSLNRLKALPTVADPVVIYLGVLEDEKTAVFLLDAKATTQGDGVCRPRPGDCQTVELREGETAFFDVTNEEGGAVAQYQLDLVKIRRTKTTAAKARKAEARGGRELLRERLAQAARFEFDAGRGVLEALPAKAAKAKLARIARAAVPAGD